LKIFIVIYLMCISTSTFAQQTDLPKRHQTLGVSFVGGYNKTTASERFKSTGNGYQVEGVIRYGLSPVIWVGVGGLWSSTPTAEVPEFDVFAPLDHSALVDYSQFFFDLRYILSRDVTQVSPYFSGRFGWTKELAEYSGAEVRRAGLMVSGLGGLEIILTRHITFDVSAMISIAKLGDADVFGNKAQNSASLASYSGLRGGVLFGF